MAADLSPNDNEPLLDLDEFLRGLSVLWPGFNQFLCVPEPSEVEVEPSPNVSGSVLDFLNESLFDLIVFLLDESLPVVHEDM